ncbi:MAG: sigma-54 dependent transcriptional regulator [Pelagibacterales bacterium]|nr:sigma-54 dependent transcriptional regulator [Pelagibacterales bacterium]
MIDKKILIIDDEKDIRDSISGILNDEGYTPVTAKNSNEALITLNENTFDVIVLDIWLNDSELDGIQLLKEIKKFNAEIPVLIISGHGNIEIAVEAIKNGAYEFIEKPFSSERLLLTVKRSIETSLFKRENKSLKQKNLDDYKFIGDSNTIIKVKQLIDKVAPTSSRVIIYGDSGTGKDLVAKEIHKKSKYSNGNFIILNSALMEPDGIEEELFGLEKHSKIMKQGFFEQANNGTLFIDEIGDMPIQTQSKILRVLTDSSFYRVGSNIPVNINARLLCSSTENLEKLVEEGNFRMDLFHRLNVVSITLPKLSDRIQDIDKLIEYFSKIYLVNTGFKVSDLRDYIKTNYMSYEWPGNVRELRNIIERYCIIGGKIPENKDELDSGFNSKNVISMPLKNARKIFEKNYLESQIQRFNGNISKTASFIGMERSALHRKLKQLGISIDNKE